MTSQRWRAGNSGWQLRARSSGRPGSPPRARPAEGCTPIVSRSNRIGASAPGAADKARRAAGLRRWVPGLDAVSTYHPGWLSKDVFAGLVLTTLLVPQGMAYAELAGLPPITGLYTSLFCLLGYAVFGPSRVLVLGPDSSLGP